MQIPLQATAAMTSHTFWGGGAMFPHVIVMTNDHPPKSHPDPHLHCPAFRQHVGSLQRGYQVYPRT